VPISKSGAEDRKPKWVSSRPPRGKTIRDRQDAKSNTGLPMGNAVSEEKAKKIAWGGGEGAVDQEATQKQTKDAGKVLDSSLKKRRKIGNGMGGGP